MDRNAYDLGDRARTYALTPYAHHKKEVYAYLVASLRTLPAGATVVDLGAGPGHLCGELLRARSDLRFVNVDQSPALLAICQRRYGGSAGVTVAQRDLNEDGWERDLPAPDAVVSTNALFPCARRAASRSTARSGPGCGRAAGCSTCRPACCLVGSIPTNPIR